jgi:hypothetical protein
MDTWFRQLQLVSSALFSYSHGSNDAQKTAGIITGVLVTSGYLKEFHVPWQVSLAAYMAIGLGTMSGGWRIIKTMGGRLTRLKPRSGFLRRNGGRSGDTFRVSPGDVGLYDAHGRGRDRGRGLDPTREGRPLGGGG